MHSRLARVALSIWFWLPIVVIALAAALGTGRFALVTLIFGIYLAYVAALNLWGKRIQARIAQDPEYAEELQRRNDATATSMGKLLAGISIAMMAVVLVVAFVAVVARLE